MSNHLHDPTARGMDALAIKQPYIAIFGSGNSLLSLDQKTLNLIDERCFVITMNYGPLHFKSDLNVWSDPYVTAFLDKHYKQKKKDRLFLTRLGHKLFGKEEILNTVDFWFDPHTEQLQGNITIVWLLQLLLRHYPNKTLLLFGIDLYTESASQAKWYDAFTSEDKVKRGSQFSPQHKLDDCANQLAHYIGKSDKVLNCNLKSRLELFEKRHLHTILF